MATKIYGAYTNTDLTEGRGSDLLVGLFSSEAAADTCAIGIGVQGSRGLVKELTVHESFEGWFENAAGYERDVHIRRLKKAREQIDKLIAGVEETRER